MKKIDSSLLVCTSDQVLQLIGLGLLPISSHCYILENGIYTYAGEYMGDENCVPAWTMEELHVMIGGDINKPDMFSLIRDYRPQRDEKGDEHERNVRLMHYYVDFPNVKKVYPNGAQAAADWLIFLITGKHLKANECSERLDNFYNKNFPENV